MTNDPNRTDPARDPGGADAVGAYKDRKSGGSSILPLLLGLLGLLILLGLILWALGVFGGDDDDVDTIDRDNDPALVDDNDVGDPLIVEEGVGTN